MTADPEGSHLTYLTHQTHRRTRLRSRVLAASYGGKPDLLDPLNLPDPRYTTRTMAGSSLPSRAAPAMARASVSAARTALPAGCEV